MSGGISGETSGMKWVKKPNAWKNLSIKNWYTLYTLRSFHPCLEKCVPSSHIVLQENGKVRKKFVMAS